MNDKIIHRGPDSEGKFSSKEHEYSIAMAMRRLAIIDLDSGDQPMYSEDGSKVIVFNGEIYNYKELRNELVAKGCQFSTTSDTEVILKLYENEGTKALHFLILNRNFQTCINEYKADSPLQKTIGFKLDLKYFFRFFSNFIKLGPSLVTYFRLKQALISFDTSENFGNSGATVLMSI